MQQGIQEHKERQTNSVGLKECLEHDDHKIDRMLLALAHTGCERRRGQCPAAAVLIDDEVLKIVSDTVISHPDRHPDVCQVAVRNQDHMPLNRHVYAAEKTKHNKSQHQPHDSLLHSSSPGSAC